MVSSRLQEQFWQCFNKISILSQCCNSIHGCGRSGSSTKKKRSLKCQQNVRKLWELVDEVHKLSESCFWTLLSNNWQKICMWKKEKCTSLDFFAVCSDLSMHESVVSGKEKIGVDTSPKTGAQATELRTPLAKKRRTEEGYYPAPEISREAVKWRPNLKYTFEFQVLQNSVRHFHQMLYLYPPHFSRCHFYTRHVLPMLISWSASSSSSSSSSSSLMMIAMLFIAWRFFNKTIFWRSSSATSWPRNVRMQP